MRYEEKIKGIKGLDPYEHSDRSGDVKLLPNYQHLYNYMILNISAYTNKVFSNFKSLQQAQVFFYRWMGPGPGDWKSGAENCLPFKDMLMF